MRRTSCEIGSSYVDDVAKKRFRRRGRRIRFAIFVARRRPTLGRLERVKRQGRGRDSRRRSTRIRLPGEIVAVVRKRPESVPHIQIILRPIHREQCDAPYFIRGDLRRQRVIEPHGPAKTRWSATFVRRSWDDAFFSHGRDPFFRSSRMIPPFYRG